MSDYLAGDLPGGQVIATEGDASCLAEPLYFVLGRKTWLFSQPVNGAKVSANLYTLIETAKANRLELFDYLNRMFKELPDIQSVDELDALLPWNSTKP